MNHTGILGVDRRRFLRAAAAIAAGGMTTVMRSEDVAHLQFENGDRPLVRYPQKRPLLRLTSRPPQLETPFAVFNDGLVTPNDAFFVRYHLAPSPPPMTALGPDSFRLTVSGGTKPKLAFSVEDLRKGFDPVEVTAVNQCSGNSRGFFQPRVPGGQMGHGAMGNAKWTGVRLKDLLERAGVPAGTLEVWFNGLDKPVLPSIPDFIKSIGIDHALDGEILVAYSMNGEDLPWLNGYPLRLVVPGFYGTYWVKHLNEISISRESLSGFWMNPAYRIPDSDCACVEPETRERAHCSSCRDAQGAYPHWS